MENKVIIFPTDTVYGIGASLYDLDSQLRIYEIKHRPLSKPLAVLVSSLSQMEEIAYLDDKAKKLVEAFLPGPLTLILKAKPDIKSITGLDTIGVRIPNYKTALDILNEYGPMATTSVNESGEPSMNNYLEIKETFDNLVDEIYPPSDEETSSLPSTIVDCTTSEIKLIRNGSISIEDINKIIK